MIRWTYVYDAVHYLFVNYDNVIEFIMQDIDAEKIESIESHMNISRRRKNNWNNIEDYK